ncbi:MAG TPA: TIGR04290 family methyltransferase [Chthoniobacterales bacterium]
MPTPTQSPESLRQEIERLGDWFQNFHLGELQTAPDHPLGDYPAIKWNNFRGAIPDDLEGASVLEIGCNAGYYSFEMKKRGAGRVVGIDTDERYLRQAEFMGRCLGLEIEWRRLSVYDVRTLGESFDYVLFLGVLYHLRYPLLALDLVRRHVAHGVLLVQSMLRGSADLRRLEPDYPFSETAVFDGPEYPKLHFVEHSYSGDWTNWWIPNRACLEAMLRSAGYDLVAHPEAEVYVCKARQQEFFNDDRSSNFLERT